MYCIPYSEDYLAHHGILGMKWGVRRYQNADGSLTALGRKHYNKQMQKAEDRRAKEYRNYHNSRGRTSKPSQNVLDVTTRIFANELRNNKEYKDYRKAQDELERYEITKWDGAVSSNNKHHQLEVKANTAREAYDKKINDVYKEHAEEILSARLKDLGLPDNDLYRTVLSVHQKDKLRDLHIDEDYYLQIFMH